ncbi:hypothetical protein ACKKBG_A21545 [Auxenochlorella protothecoides x Auxenochlorella symbiontica]
MDRQTGSAKKKKATSPAATAPAPVAVPNQEPFGPKLAALCYFGLFASLVICLTGILGLAILMDVRTQEQWYSKTAFAPLWLKFTENNPYTTTLCVNGGAGLAIFLAKRIYEHRSALKAQKRR